MHILLVLLSYIYINTQAVLIVVRCTCTKTRERARATLLSATFAFRSTFYLLVWHKLLASKQHNMHRTRIVEYSYYDFAISILLIELINYVYMLKMFQHSNKIISWKNRHPPPPTHPAAHTQPCECGCDMPYLRWKSAWFSLRVHPLGVKTNLNIPQKQQQQLLAFDFG